MSEKPLGILDCDELDPSLKPGFDSYGRMFMRLLSPLAEDILMQRFSVVDGEIPEQPDQCRAYLITGSRAGVYDDSPWLPGLRRFILETYARHIKLIGICFGHQVLADVLGGRAEKSDRGWGIGVLRARRQAQSIDWFNSLPDELDLLYSHQDQVLKLPSDAKNIYASDFCPYAAFWIPRRVLAFQGHPEFTIEYSRRLMQLRVEKYPPERYRRAMESLAKPVHSKAVADCMVRFIREENF